VTLPQITWQVQQAAVAEKNRKTQKQDRESEREREANNTYTRKAFLVF
jgi:hypothetical protein